VKIGIWAKSLGIPQKTGLEIYTENLIQSLAKIDKKNSYVIYSDRVLRYDFLRQKNFKLKVLSWPFSKLWTQIRLPVELMSHKPDLVFFPSFTMPFFTPAKSVITIHDTFVFDFPEHYPFIEKFSFAFWIKVALKKGAAIIAPSKCIQREIIQKWPKCQCKIFVTYLGYNPEYYPRDPREIEQIKEKYGINQQYFIHVVGGYVARKNSERVLQAFAELDSDKNGIRMVFVGRNFGPEYQKIKQLTEELGLKEFVKFLEYVPAIDLAALLSGATASVYPSLSEGFGLPILEAMACGVPVITSNFGAMAEVAGKAAILVNPNNVEEIAKAMQTIWTNGTIRKKYQTLGLERAKHFSWGKCAQETLKIFETVGAR